MNYLTAIAVPAITGAIYALIEILKKVTNNNEKVLIYTAYCVRSWCHCRCDLFRLHS